MNPVQISIKIVADEDEHEIILPPGFIRLIELLGASYGHNRGQIIRAVLDAGVYLLGQELFKRHLADWRRRIDVIP